MKKYKTNFPIYGDKYNFMNQMNDMDDMYDMNDMYDMYQDYNDNYMSNGIYMPNIMPEMSEEETDKAFEKDMAYMKEMYPDICKRIQKYIDEECAKMDYEGSYMYDDYPDKEIINIITDRIYDKVENQEAIFNHSVETSANVDIQRRRQNWRRNTIKIMLLNEMYRRRRKKCRKYHKNKPYYGSYYSPYQYYGAYKPRRSQNYYTNPYIYY